MEWESVVADQVFCLLVSANHNCVPRSIGEWMFVSRRFLLSIYVSQRRTRLHGVTLDDIIVVAPDPDPRQVSRHIVHELAEYLLQSEWETPCNVPSVNLVQDRHRIAIIVENRVMALSV